MTIRCSMLTPEGVTTRDFEDLDADLAAVWASMHAPLAVDGSVSIGHLHTSDDPNVGTG